MNGGRRLEIDGRTSAEQPLERARLALGVVDQLAGLDTDEMLEAIARGLEVGKAQLAYMRLASTCALVSIAESLAGILDDLERGR